MSDLVKALLHSKESVPGKDLEAKLCKGQFTNLHTYKSISNFSFPLWIYNEYSKV